ncbi:SpoIID/LytB domain-containing protein [Nocardioides sp.]|uniref:SpoIID/LytB domain-containing protein n=1 Tax=Nocardioides sp. TaxID=35761 RepID=UPI003D0CF445
MPRPLLAAALALAASTALAQPSQAAQAEVPVPPQAWVTINGHGYGHGHGMSQYGAEGAARQGLSAQAIINFYYPGTRRGTLTGKISVHLTADTDDNTVVLSRAGLRLRDLSTGQIWTLPDNGARRWRLAVGPGGASRVGYLTDAWHAWRTLEGDGAFSAGGAPVTLVTPSGQVAYRGALRSMRPSNGSMARDTVNVLNIDSYLRGVVPREMPATWRPAAVRAQAIAARTYAAYERAHPLTSTYQICDTTSCQVYGGYSAEHPDSNAAIVATAGKIQLYRGEPAFTQFASSSGGWTSAGSMPYLKAQQDPYDDWSGNPVHNWSTRVDARSIERAWPKLGNLTGIQVTSRDGNGAWGGRIVTMVLHGAKADVTVSGDTFRSVLGLRSTWLAFKATAK